MVARNNLEIAISFNDAIDRQSVTNRTFQVFGRWAGVCPGSFTFENQDRSIRFTPAKSFSAGEWITVSLTHDIRSTGGRILLNGFAWNFWTSSAAAELDLLEMQVISVRRPGEGRVRTYGAYAGDLDGDGFHDFTVPNEESHDVRVFMNSGAGGYSTFTVNALPPNSKPSTNEGADFNGDGLLDFACGNIDGGSVSVFFGTGSADLGASTTYRVAGGTRGLAILDLNCDGAPDIVTANRAGNNFSKLLNNGDGTFAASINQELGTARETACASADFNEDGIMDVAVGSFNAGFTGAGDMGDILLLLGDGSGNLNASTKVSAGGDSWMLAVGDLDGDGHADVVSANAIQNQFALFRGDGMGGLRNAETYDVGAFPLAIDVGDLDGDGDLDVVTSNFSSANWTIYENDGTGRFTNPRTHLTTGAGSCAVLHDRDLDGDLDMTGIDELDDKLVLFENPATPTGVDKPPLATSFQLQQSYPNPYAVSSGNVLSIPFVVNETAFVEIKLVNILGQTLSVVLERTFSRGRHTATFLPVDLTPGVYFYRLNVHGVQVTKSTIILP